MEYYFLRKIRVFPFFKHAERQRWAKLHTSIHLSDIKLALIFNVKEKQGNVLQTKFANFVPREKQIATKEKER